MKPSELQQIVLTFSKFFNLRFPICEIMEIDKAVTQ